MVFRRGNKSNKVPNVKLRPPPPPSSRPQPEPRYSLDSGFDSQQDATQSYLDVCPRPFKSVVLCATGISDKTTLFKQAIELGAQPLNDLTDKVTHLLALEPGSAKYNCALQNRIPIMHPDWISESYKVWLRGDDVNLEESIRAYRLPIFSGVVLCVSGIEDVARRTEINRLVTSQGGSYVKNIERPVRVTHLLCATGLDQPSEKMQYAAKFNARKEADICLVWEQWFWDCLKLQGRCSEENYDIARPPPEPVADPEREPAPAEPVHASSSRNIEGLDGEEHEDEEPARAVKRVPAVTLQIWQSILQPRGFALQEGRLVRSPSKSQAPPAIPMQQDSPSKGRDAVRARVALPEKAAEDKEKPSVLRGLTKSSSFAPQLKDASTPRQPFARAPSNIFAAPPEVTILAQGGDDLPVASSSRIVNDVPSQVDAHEDEDAAADGAGGIFKGKTFCAMGEARSQAVRQAVEQGGGRMVREEDDDDVDFVIVRLVSGSKIYREDPDPVERSKYRTECWLERCLFEERICPPEEHVSFTPIPVPIPIDGAERISLSFSGLDQSEACWVRRLARALGMTLAPNFSRRTTHLLCPARSGAKFDKALEWGVPVVDMAWLEGIVRAGVVPPWEPRRLSAASDAATSEVGARRKEKGKGRAPPGDAGLVDITNAPLDAPQDPPRPPSPLPRRPSSPLGDDDYLDAPFGKPSGLLDESHTEPEIEPHLIPGLDGAHAGGADSSSSSSRQPSETRSLADLREDMLNTTIASSQSPSPLKIPTPFRSPAKRGVADFGVGFSGGFGVVDAEGNAREPRTPSRISRAASDELQARLASLLGKRPADEVQEDDLGEGADDALPAVKRRARALSRTKSKDARTAYEHYFERSNSATSIVLDDAPLATPREVDLDDLVHQPPPNGLLGRGALARTPSGAGVLYQDPAQLQHRARLMSLLGPDNGSAAPEDDWSALLRDAPPANAGAQQGRGARGAAAKERAANSKQGVPEPKKRPRRSAARRR